MKHWTEPNGIFLMKIPTHWQYLNPAMEDGKEKSPYSFQPYENPIGCFQISCYPLKELSPKLADKYQNGAPCLKWRLSRMDDSEFCVHLFLGELADQAFIGKYIYYSNLENDPRISEELRVVNNVLESFVIVPSLDRKLASDLDRLDRFHGALAASYDLLDSAIESNSFIEMIVISASQIDAFLRLSLVIAIQLKNQTNDIPLKYIFQADDERGIMERKIYDEALKYGVITDLDYEELDYLYKLRNRVIHRYVISDIKTRELPGIALKYIETHEKIRLILRGLEEEQARYQFGIYGKQVKKCSEPNDEQAKRLFSMVNDKHLLRKFAISI